MNPCATLVVCCVLLLGGCQQPTPDTVAVLNNDPAVTAAGDGFMTRNRQYQLLISKPESGIPVNAYFDLLVEVRSAVGQTLPYPVDLEFSAGMKAHNHGMNTAPQLKKLGSNLFRIEPLLFHMPGEWNLDFRVWRGVMGDHAEVTLEVQP